METLQTKQCARCKQIKPTTDFHKLKESKDGLKYYCAACSNKAGQDYKLRNPEKFKESKRNYRLRNLEKERANARDYQRRLRADKVAYQKQSIKRASFDRKKRYGLEESEYQRMLMDQAFLCKICRKPETAIYHGKPRTLCVDHCHSTGSIRGLLCHRCNAMVGLAKDDSAVLRRASEYVTDSKALQESGVTVEK